MIGILQGLSSLTLIFELALFWAVAGAILTLGIAGFMALRLGARFELTDGLLFGTVGGVFGVIGVVVIAPVMIEGVDTGVQPAGWLLIIFEGLASGAVLGGAAGLIATCRTVSRERRIQQRGPAV